MRPYTDQYVFHDIFLWQLSWSSSSQSRHVQFGFDMRTRAIFTLDIFIALCRGSAGDTSQVLIFGNFQITSLTVTYLCGKCVFGIREILPIFDAKRTNLFRFWGIP